MAITLTTKAACELKELMTSEGKMNAGLRVWVAGGGCSGLSYGMALDDQAPEEGDLTFEHEGIKIYVDQGSLHYMEGAVVDFVDDEFGGGYTILNPTATSSCGCGSSFKTADSEDKVASGGCGSCSTRG